MNVTVVVNVWFLVSLCLVCVLIGGLLFRSGRDRYRY